MSDPNMEEGSDGMTRDTKVGLLAGLAFIICFAIILSNRGAPPPQATDQPYLVDRGASARHAAQPAAAPPMTGQTLSGTTSRASVTPPASHASPGQAADAGGSGSGAPPATTGASVVLPMQHSPSRPAATVASTGILAEREVSAPFVQTTPTQPLGSPDPTLGRHDQSTGLRMLEPVNPAGPDGRTVASADPQRALLQPTAGSSGEPQNPSVSGPPATPGNRHTVATGDTLYKIAQKHYGTQSKSVVDAIYEANRSVLPGPNALRVGAELILPAVGAAGAPAAAMVGDTSPPTTTSHKSRTPAERKATKAAPQKPAPKPEPADPASRWYQVRKNDRYVSIAREQLGDPSRWQEIYQLNKDKFPDPQQIREGVRIKLPGTAIASSGGARP